MVDFVSLEHIIRTLVLVFFILIITCHHVVHFEDSGTLQILIEVLYGVQVVLFAAFWIYFIFPKGFGVGSRPEGQIHNLKHQLHHLLFNIGHLVYLQKLLNIEASLPFNLVPVILPPNSAPAPHLQLRLNLLPHLIDCRLDPILLPSEQGVLLATLEDQLG